jgi:hypothetical protein
MIRWHPKEMLDIESVHFRDEKDTEEYKRRKVVARPLDTLPREVGEIERRQLFRDSC